jgi:hypothetical protein
MVTTDCADCMEGGWGDSDTNLNHRLHGGIRRGNEVIATALR